MNFRYCASAHTRIWLITVFPHVIITRMYVIQMIFIERLIENFISTRLISAHIQVLLFWEYRHKLVLFVRTLYSWSCCVQLFKNISYDSLFLSSIGPTERSVQIAKLEVKRVLKEELLRQVGASQFFIFVLCPFIFEILFWILPVCMDFSMLSSFLCLVAH